MRMLLIRHADAGSRRTWSGVDRDRPLSELGVRQARALVDLLIEHKPTAIVSSPYLRCLQTVRPFADAAGMEVEQLEDLGAECTDVAGPTLRAVAARAAATAAGEADGEPVIAVCTHGEIIAAGLHAIGAASLVGDAPIPGPKGGTWLLSVSGSGVDAVEVLSPPA